MIIPQYGLGAVDSERLSAHQQGMFLTQSMYSEVSMYLPSLYFGLQASLPCLNP